jgi:alpha-L-rhamnosidase
VLADYGYADDAAAILLQPEYPGFADIIAQGATTLWETWDGNSSLNHVMFADPSAWFFEYLAGIRPQFTGGGFKEVIFSPCPVSQLEDAGAEYTLADGRKICANWKREEENIIYTIDLPAGINAKLEFNGTSHPVPAGKNVFLLNKISF